MIKKLLKKLTTAYRVAKGDGVSGVYSTFMYRYFWPIGSRVSRNAAKHWEEIRYWKRQARQGALDNSWYVGLFTDPFGLSAADYDGKRILDIGCGPLGSLEWAKTAKERIGLDPLVSKYKNLGIEAHGMQYVQGRSEQIPFEEGYFDFVSCFNALDHVDDVSATLLEIVRVLKVGGRFLLMVDVGHNPTLSEPHKLAWGLLDQISNRCHVLKYQRFEQMGSAALSVHQGKMISSQTTCEEGVLLAMLEKHC